MIFVYTWIVFIFSLSIFLKIYLCKKYKDVIDILGFTSNFHWSLITVSLKPLRKLKDKRAKKVYTIMLMYKIIYLLGIAIFLILIKTKKI